MLSAFRLPPSALRPPPSLARPFPSPAPAPVSTDPEIVAMKAQLLQLEAERIVLQLTGCDDAEAPAKHQDRIVFIIEPLIHASPRLYPMHTLPLPRYRLRPAMWLRRRRHAHLAGIVRCIQQQQGSLPYKRSRSAPALSAYRQKSLS